MNVFEIVFSPTGGTEKVSDELAKVFDPNIQKIDLTAPDTDFSSVEISKEKHLRDSSSVLRWKSAGNGCKPLEKIKRQSG